MGRPSTDSLTIVNLTVWSFICASPWKAGWKSPG
jgi:hypothetical protein